MLGFLLKKIIGTRTERELKKLRPMVARINQFEASYQALPLEALAALGTAWLHKPAVPPP